MSLAAHPYQSDFPHSAPRFGIGISDENVAKMVGD
jgi:hypothetical protein